MILVIYASKHGATEGIARFIAERLTERGKQADARPAGAAGELGHPEAVVLGSAIYAGSWLKEATEFVHGHRDGLAQVPVWLFSSGPLGTEVQDDEQQPKQLAELSEALRPRDHATFFGALDRGSLGFAERMMVKAVKAPEGDFRDWDAIRAWTDRIVDELDAPAG
jgi:menaquinone-dependent protoporphyrinogen oxidase